VAVTKRFNGLWFTVVRGVLLENIKCAVILCATTTLHALVVVYAFVAVLRVWDVVYALAATAGRDLVSKNNGVCKFAYGVLFVGWVVVFRHTIEELLPVGRFAASLRTRFAAPRANDDVLVGVSVVGHALWMLAKNCFML
jgi:hypothetical protein